MSKYDDPMYETLYEKMNKAILNVDDKSIDTITDFQNLFKNEEVKVLLEKLKLKGEDKEDFLFMCNNQEKVTGKFLHHCKIIKPKMKLDEKKEILLDYIHNKYNIINEDNFNKIISEVFESKEFMQKDKCRKMIYDLFKKYQIDLSDKSDREIFIKNFIKDKIVDNFESTEILGRLFKH